MIPTLKQFRNVENLTIFETTCAKIGAGFSIEPCDLETEATNCYYEKLLAVLNQLSPQILCRIKLNVTEKTEFSGNRSDSLAYLGATTKTVNLFIELESEPEIVRSLKGLLSLNSEPDLKAILETYNLLASSGLNIKPLTESEVGTFFLDPKLNWKKCDNSVTEGTSHFGVI